MMHLLRRFRKNESGYALVVVAALFVAFAVAIGAYLDRNVAVEQINRQKNTAVQITRLSNAILQYAYFHSGRYPCPASLTVDVSASTFGAEVTGCQTGALNTGTFAGIRGLSNTPASVDTAGTEIIMGLVPVRTLAAYGVDMTDGFDLWNDRIMYVVNRQLTPSGSGTVAVRPAVTQPNLNLTLKAPDFILISFGKDKMGGYQRSSTSISVSCPAASTVLREENCDLDLNFIKTAWFTPSNATASNYFDDLISPYAP